MHTYSDMLYKLATIIYLEFRGEILHQNVDIPTVTNCVGCIANVYCFTYEIQFTRRKVNEETMLWRS